MRDTASQAFLIPANPMHACRQEELGHRSFAALTSTSKHRAMLQSMAASDVAVMLKEDQKLGLPQFCSTTKGLDFQRHFTTQLAGPLTGVEAADCK